MDTSEDSEVVPPGRFVETYEGCSEAFSGGRTFMDAFHDDQYADERQSNLYFPFASRKEWQLASWLLRSRLSLGAIDSLLALDIVRQFIFRFPLSQLNVIQLQEVPLSFHTGNQLRARAELLPSGPAWLCEELQPEGPCKQSAKLFYRQPLECLQSLLSHPLLAPHIDFVPRKVWTSAARICRIYDEWLTGDRAWNIQVSTSPCSYIQIDLTRFTERSPRRRNCLGGRFVIG